MIVREPGSARPIREAEVTVQLAPSDGEPVLLYAGRTGAQGTAEVGFLVPDYGPDRVEADLIVRTTSAQGEAEIREPIVVQRAYRLHLLSDKPLYRPGQTVYLRTLALEAVRGLPAVDRRILFRVQGVNGETLYERTVPASAYGIASTTYALPAGAAHGTYRLIAALGDTVSSAHGDRGPVRAPLLQGQPRDGSALLPGRSGCPGPCGCRNTGRASPAQRTGYAARLRPRPQPPAAGYRRGQDGSGRNVDRRVRPADVPRRRWSQLGPAGLCPRQGRRDRLGGAAVPLAAQELKVDVVAEGGRLRPGIENAIAFLCSTPDGVPAPATLAIEIEGRAYALQTDAFGLAFLRYTPSPDADATVVRVAAQTADGRRATRETTLSADQGPAQVLLRLDRAVYQTGESMHLEAFAAQGDAIYFDLVRRDAGHTVSTHVARLRQGRASLELDVSPDMAGTVEVHAYQVLPDGSVAQDTRLALIDTTADLQVTVQPNRASYRPGDAARLLFETTIDGAPTQSAMGIAIVDESVHALEERAPGFAKLYFMLEDSLLRAAAQPGAVAFALPAGPPDGRGRSRSAGPGRSGRVGQPTGKRRPRAARRVPRQPRPSLADPRPGCGNDRRPVGAAGPARLGDCPPDAPQQGDKPLPEADHFALCRPGSGGGATRHERHIGPPGAAQRFRGRGPADRLRLGGIHRPCCPGRPRPATARPQPGARPAGRRRLQRVGRSAVRSGRARRRPGRGPVGGPRFRPDPLSGSTPGAERGAVGRGAAQRGCVSRCDGSFPGRGGRIGRDRADPHFALCPHRFGPPGLCRPDWVG